MGEVGTTQPPAPAWGWRDLAELEDRQEVDMQQDREEPGGPGRAASYLPAVARGPRADLKLQVGLDVVGDQGGAPGHVACVGPNLEDLEGVGGQEAHWGQERRRDSWVPLGGDSRPSGRTSPAPLHH